MRVLRTDDTAFLVSEQHARASGCPSAFAQVKWSFPAPGAAVSPRDQPLQLPFLDALCEELDGAAHVACLEAAVRLDPYPERVRDLGAAARNAGVVKASAARMEKVSPAVAAAVLFGGGDRARGLEAMKRAHATTALPDEWVAEYVFMLEDAGQRKQALGVIAAHRKQHGSTDDGIIEAFLLQRAGQPDAGIRLLEAELEARPSASVLDSLVELQLDVKRPQQALDALEQGTRRGIELDATLLTRRAKAELSLKKFSEAKATLEAALRLDAEAAEARRLLDSVRNWLGEGRNEALSEPIAPLAIPPQVPLEAGAASQESQHPAVYESIVRVISYEPGKRWVETEYLRARIKDREGVERFSTMRYALNPSFEHLYVNSLRVTDAKGKLLGEGSAASAWVTDDAEASMATTERLVHLPVPGLEPGAVVEVVVSRSSNRPLSESNFEHHFFGTSLPTRVSALVLIGSGVSTHAQHLAGEKSAGEAGGARWWVVRDAPRMRPQLFSGSALRFEPVVTFGPQGGTWETAGKEYLADVRALLEPDAETSELARTVTAGLRDREERIRALTSWVQDHVTYKAIEFGRGARVPRAANDVRAKGYGDCKDQALLLTKLLRASGEQASLALLNAEEPVDRGIVSLDQFNHMIVWLPKDRFIDPTSGSADATGTTDALAGQDALVLEDQKVRFVTIPPGRTDVGLAVTRTVRREGSDAVVREDVLATGFFAGQFRSAFAEARGKEREQRVRSWLDERARVTRTDFELAGDGRARLAVEYVLPGQFRSSGPFTLPLEWERARINLRADDTEERRAPVQLRFHLNIESTTTFSELHLKPVTASGKAGWGAWSLASEGPVLRFSYQRQPFEGPPSSFAPLLQQHEDIVHALGQPMVSAK